MATRMLAMSGYGLWVWLGLGLAVGVFPAGRGDTLVPLAWGGALIGLGPLLACLPWIGLPEWLGWRFGRHSRPTAEGLIALAAFLPMMAVAGPARGDNLFWATRLSGGALAALSLVTLVYAMRLPRTSVRGWGPVFAASAGRMVAALYSGGLWLFAMAQGGEDAPGLWIALVQLVTVVAGVLDAIRWRALWRSKVSTTSAKRRQTRARHMLSGLLVYVLPGVVLLLTPWGVGHTWLATLAAVGCVLGKSLDQDLYHRSLARADSHLSPA